MNTLRWALVLGWLVGALSPLAAQRVDTIRVGSAALRGATPLAGTYTLESFQRHHGHDTPISTTVQTVTRRRARGLDVYAIQTVHASGDGDTTTGVILVRAGDFALLHHRVKAKQDSAAVAVAGGYVTGWVVLPGEPMRLVDQRLEGPVFPVEGQIPWLFPLLPLAEGYLATIPHYSQWEGREDWATIRVIGSESVARGGNVFDCWKVDGGELFPGFWVVYWVDKRTRRVVEGVARGPEAGPEYWSRMRTP